MSDLTVGRAEYWRDFSLRVMEHIEDYTVPQYGDYPDDQMTDAEIAEIKGSLKRYVNRINSNARGQEEALRDCLKIASYSAILERRILET